MNRLDAARRTQVLSCLLEGCSIRATVRMTGVSKKTVSRLLVEAGNVCAGIRWPVGGLPTMSFKVGAVSDRALQGTPIAEFSPQTLTV